MRRIHDMRYYIYNDGEWVESIAEWAKYLAAFRMPLISDSVEIDRAFHSFVVYKLTASPKLQSIFSTAPLPLFVLLTTSTLWTIDKYIFKRVVIGKYL